jgi:predicted XRE-type DNA-binding protein
MATTERDRRGAEPDWFAEIEFRRYLRDQYPFEEADRQFIPTEPDPQRTEPTTERDYWVLKEDREGRERHIVHTLDAVDPDTVEITSNKIVVPLETVEQIGAGDLEEWLIENVLSGMFVRTSKPEVEPENDGTIRLGGGSGRYGRVNAMRWEFTGDIATPDPSKTRAGTGQQIDKRFRFVHDPRPVYVQIPPEHEFCDLNNIWEKRRRQNRDMKMLITARDSATGTGKTTLAVALAKAWDEHGWNAEKATLSPEEYVSTYTDLRSGEILIGDEMEQMADPRRSMSTQNLTLTQYWSTMRQWEVSTICTLPSAAMVDKRLRELMDIRINVQERGLAVAYEKKVDDHSGEIREKRLHRVRWNPLDNDPDYRELARMKKRHMENFNETAYFMSESEDDEPDPDEAVRQYRNERINAAYEAGEWTQKELAAVFDVSRPRVSQILSENGDE